MHRLPATLVFTLYSSTFNTFAFQTIEAAAWWEWFSTTIFRVFKTASFAVGLRRAQPSRNRSHKLFTDPKAE
jgi:hypothetical protein